MNKLRIIVGCLLAVIMTASVIAEPIWVQPLSVDYETQSHSTDSYSIGKTSGSNKHIPYAQRYIEINSDTELALFDQGDAKMYQRPSRSDRIPRS